MFCLKSSFFRNNYQILQIKSKNSQILNENETKIYKYKRSNKYELSIKGDSVDFGIFVERILEATCRRSVQWIFTLELKKNRIIYK